MTTRTILAVLTILVGALISGGRSVQAVPPPVQLTSCLGVPATILGDGSGTVNGTGGRDVIVGFPNVSEEINSYGGDDLICAGAGDEVYAGSGNDEVYAYYVDGGNPNAAFVSGGSGGDIISDAYDIRGDGGNDTLYIGYTRIRGGSGNDSLANSPLCDGGSGTDVDLGGCTTTVKIP